MVFSSHVDYIQDNLLVVTIIWPQWSYLAVERDLCVWHGYFRRTQRTILGYFIGCHHYLVPVKLSCRLRRIFTMAWLFRRIRKIIPGYFIGSYQYSAWTEFAQLSWYLKSFHLMAWYFAVRWWGVNCRLLWIKYAYLLATKKNHHHLYVVRNRKFSRIHVCVEDCNTDLPCRRKSKQLIKQLITAHIHARKWDLSWT